MARASLSLLLAALTVPVFPQVFTNHHITAPVVRRNVAIDLGAGHTFYACERAYGYDSSRVELLWTDADQVVTHARSYRLHFPLTFLNTAVRVDDGFLVGGMNYGSNAPCLLKTDAAGDVDWCVTVGGLTAQDQIVQLIPYGGTFAAYTYPGGTYADRLYRLSGAADGSSLSGVVMTAPSGVTFRVYKGVAASSGELVCGAGMDVADPGNMRAVVAHVGDNGVQWMNHYDLGSGPAQVEDANGLTRLSDGNFLCMGQTTASSPFEAFVMKLGPAGNVIWSKRYTDVSGGLLFTCAQELAGGELLLAGVDATYTGTLVKLEADGDPIWTKRYTSSSGTDLFRDFYTDDAGGLQLMGRVCRLSLDASGDGCGLEEVAPVTATPNTPVVIPVAMTNAPATPIMQQLAWSTRTPELAWTPTCTWSGIGDPTDASPLRAFPVPTDGRVYLGEAGQVSPGTRVRVRALTGGTALELLYGTGVDLGDRPAGMYMLELPDLQRRVRVVKQ